MGFWDIISSDKPAEIGIYHGRRIPQKHMGRKQSTPKFDDCLLIVVNQHVPINTAIYISRIFRSSGPDLTTAWQFTAPSKKRSR